MHVDTISTLLIYDSHSINLNNSKKIVKIVKSQMTLSSKVELNMDENKMKDIDMMMHEN